MASVFGRMVCIPWWRTAHAEPADNPPDNADNPTPEPEPEPAPQPTADGLTIDGAALDTLADLVNRDNLTPVRGSAHPLRPAIITPGGEHGRRPASGTPRQPNTRRRRQVRP